jgi:putative thiamine transport system substrate-binding protein
VTRPCCRWRSCRLKTALAFDALDLGVATLKPEELGPALDEPHPDWMERIEGEWLKRYGAAN